MKILFKGMDCTYREVQEFNGKIVGTDAQPLSSYDGAFYKQISEDEALMLIVGKDGAILHVLGRSMMPVIP